MTNEDKEQIEIKNFISWIRQASQLEVDLIIKKIMGKPSLTGVIHKVTKSNDINLLIKIKKSLSKIVDENINRLKKTKDYTMRNALISELSTPEIIDLNIFLSQEDIKDNDLIAILDFELEQRKNQQISQTEIEDETNPNER